MVLLICCTHVPNASFWILKVSVTVWQSELSWCFLCYFRFYMSNFLILKSPWMSAKFDNCFLKLFSKYQNFHSSHDFKRGFELFFVTYENDLINSQLVNLLLLLFLCKPQTGRKSETYKKLITLIIRYKLKILTCLFSRWEIFKRLLHFIVLMRIWMFCNF